MIDSLRKNENGSMLVMAVVLSFATVLLGVTFLTFAMTLRGQVDEEISDKQALYAAHAGAMKGVLSRIAGQPRRSGWHEFYDETTYGSRLISEGQRDEDYGTSTSLRIVGMGRSNYMETDHYKEVIVEFSYETYADYLYISNAEHDSLRHATIRFWTPDTLDGKVHSNDTIHIVPTIDRPYFKKRVTTTRRAIDPVSNHARFDDGWGYRGPIIFPDQVLEIRQNAGYRWGTGGSDSLTQLCLSGNYIYVRKCGLFRVNDVDKIKCYPATISSAPYFAVPPSGVVFVYGKCWVSASRGRKDMMDGEFPESSFVDGDFYSTGFTGQLTIGSSDSMIITDNVIYEHAKPNFSVPSTMDSCSDILGLVSENYIMVGRHVRDTVYINAALAATSGSISVQDIYWTQPPLWDNEKQSLFIYGSLAQRNRGIVHTTDNPPGHLRGFIEKDYHYDVRLRDNPPPHFVPTQNSKIRFIEEIFSGG